MAFEDVFEGGLGTGLLFGVGVMVLAPFAKRVLRPAAKAVLKGGMTVYRETGMGDAVDDLVAEARSELDDSHREETQARRTRRTEQPQTA